MASRSPDDDTAQRNARLSKLLHSYLEGTRTARTPNDGKLLLEAIAAQGDRVGCVERLAGSKPALDSLKNALRFDTSPSFLNGPLTGFLTLLTDHDVSQTCGGELQRILLDLVVRPPTLWEALVSIHATKQLSLISERAFAAILLALVAWTNNPPVDVDDAAQSITDKKTFIESDDRAVRTIGYRIQHILQSKSKEIQQETYGPGGRHDNDHADFRKISVFPTDDELMSKEPAYFRPANAINQKPFEARAGVHLDNQYRLQREDFLAELREDVSVSQGKTKNRRPRMRLERLSIAGIHCGNGKFKAPFALALFVGRGLAQLPEMGTHQRKAFLKDNPKFLKHQSFGCAISKDRVVAFATLHRDEDLLMQSEPIIVIRTPDRPSLEKLLTSLKSPDPVDFLLVDTPVFAYEPVLRCLQQIVEVPLWQELFAISPEEVEAAVRTSTIAPLDLIDRLEKSEGKNLQSVFSSPKPVKLDHSQLQSLLAGLRQSISLIQGPPGTGKSFLGALLAKALLEYTNEKILVICFTNHALDQFLEDLMDVGIPSTSMVRLGAKSTPRTEPLQLSKQTPIGRPAFGVINSMRPQADEQESTLKRMVSSLRGFQPDRRSLMEHLEFSDEDFEYFSAFQLPEGVPGHVLVGKKGKPISKHYLYDRWRYGQDPGIFSRFVLPEFERIWSMDQMSRNAKFEFWANQLLQDRISGVGALSDAYNQTENTLRKAFDQRDAHIIRNKRIIACTTTAAAKYNDHIRNAAPGIIIVEEAGEILESHVLTAMTPSTKQLVLIGDHQQLRPKTNNYALTVERGEGYDLNRSMFERLICAGLPHTTLLQQHRMSPEISSLVRELTYPDLVDASSTLSRAAVKGLQSRVSFIDHRNLELSASNIADRKDEGSTVSKENAWEASMVLKIIRYMAQQGYGTAKQVVLTPYLGQLSLLRRELAKDHDPVLNDLDSAHLIKAGLLSPSSAAQNKQPIRLSTIDNYQGEECEIVIASLTRSNKHGDIGFMAAKERLNVLLSRARTAIIIIGNSDTFLASKKGANTWKPFFKLLSASNNIYDGLVVKCEQHAGREATLKEPSDFDENCPDGGCSAPCGIKLSCGIHDCPQKCHAQVDHCKMPCKVPVIDHCPKGHKQTWLCSALRPASCSTCDAQARAALKRQERDRELDLVRQQKQAAYAARLAEIKDEIEHARRVVRDNQEDEERASALLQQKKDLEAARKQSARIKAQKEAMKPSLTNDVPGAYPAESSAQDGSTMDTDTMSNDRAGHSDPVEMKEAPVSAAREEWEKQKQFEGAENQELDELMSMIGLENVKEAFLDIKANVDIVVRQGGSLSKERYGASLLGNPGTGKTTVARLYAKFLTTVGALPGDAFVETTGAKLANEGVQGCKKILQDIKNKGGGALFIDEAYQLTSGSSMGGGAVLDFLLAEVENLRGKVVFILAGYNKNMESFFQHNPGLPSRFPREIQFADYEDNELLDIMVYGIEKRYNRRMVITEGSRGLYTRIVARRIGRGRGKVGFGNARAVENGIAVIASRQAKRIRNERRTVKQTEKQPDDMLLTKEDLIGPEPADILHGNPSWKKLQQLTGLTSVKESINALFESIKFNYHRELEEKPLIEFSLNKVFLGSPGTGKTTVAKLYGTILADMGLLSTNEGKCDAPPFPDCMLIVDVVVVKTPADFVGSVLGASEANTKAILDAAIGKVLVIDEAYGLCSTSDPYKTAVIDTIVAEVQSVPGDDRCVLLLGYKSQMEEMMQTVNPGLARRFPIDSGFLFEDFNDCELAVIFDAKLRRQGFATTKNGRQVALDVLSRMRNRPNFGNAGQVDILLNDAQLRQQKRFARDRIKPLAIFEAEDFDPDYTRAERASTNLRMLFSGTVGCEAIIAQMEGYQRIAKNMNDAGMDPRDELPFTFLFRGPPGTGKTSTARKIGKVFYDMGFLATAEVVERSAKDLVGEYVGQTGPKAQKLIESALGKVLFIDEAYRLADGLFGKEAVDELVDCITKPQFLNKVVIILAGYTAEINRLMDVNPGLSSRFSEFVDFVTLDPEACLALLQTLLAKKKQIDSSPLSKPSPHFRSAVLDKLAELSRLPNFANGRDVETLSKHVVGTIMKSPSEPPGVLVVSEDVVVKQIDRMIQERVSRSQFRPGHDATGGADPYPPQSIAPQGPQPPSMTSTSTAERTTSLQDTAHAEKQELSQLSSEAEDDLGEVPHQPAVAVRDVGVSDEVWNQLQKDRLKAEEEEKERQRLLEEEEALRQWLKKCADAKRQRELEEIERKRREMEEKKRREILEQAKLARAGRCPVGYEWIRQSGGYRCAGGSHWVSDAQVNLL